MLTPTLVADRVTVRTVGNIMTLGQRTTEQLELNEPTSIADLCPRDFKAAVCIVAGKDGVGGTIDCMAPEWETFTVRDGDELLFVRVPGAEAGAAAGIGAFLVWLAKVIIVAAVGAAVSLLVQRLIGQPRSPDPLVEIAEPNTHSFAGISNSSSPGIPIAVIAGKHPHGGNIIGLFTQGQPPTVSPNSSTLSMGLGLGEGPIVGVIDTKINGNNASTVGATIETERGTLDQGSVSGSVGAGTGTRNQIAVDLELENFSLTDATAGPILTSTTSQPVDGVYLKVFHPNGLVRGLGGGYLPNDIQWRYRSRLADAGGGTPGPWSDWIQEYEQRMTIAPWTTEVFLPFATRDVYEIQMQREKVAPPDSTYIETIVWDSFDEWINRQFTYPGLANMWLRVTAQTIVSGRVPVVVPTIWGMITQKWDGVDPDNPTYVNDGPADPTVQNSAEYDFRNPAWFLLTMLRNRRWGLGNYIDESQIDLPSFKAWADWCMELVDDGSGTGSTEPRALLDAVFEGRESAMAAMLRICAVGRATLVVVGDSVTVKYEHDRDPVQIFAVGNIVEGSMRVMYTTKHGRPTRFEVRFLNAEADYQIDSVGWDDEEAIAQGLPQLVESADRFGIVRPSHAAREARFLGNLSLLNKVIEFEAFVDSIVCVPGDVILVQHDVTQWGFGGRVRDGATINTIKLDQAITLEAGVVYRIRVKNNSSDVIQTRTILDAAGTYAAGHAFSVNQDWDVDDSIPPEFSIYVFGPLGVEAKPFVVGDITLTSEVRRKITAVEYDPRIHNDAVPATQIVYTGLPDPAITPPCPAQVPTLAERLEPASGGGGWTSYIDVGWEYPITSEVAAARIYWRLTSLTVPVGVDPPYQLAGIVSYPETQFSFPGASRRDRRGARDRRDLRGADGRLPVAAPVRARRNDHAGQLRHPARRSANHVGHARRRRAPPRAVGARRSRDLVRDSSGFDLAAGPARWNDGPPAGRVRRFELEPDAHRCRYSSRRPGHREVVRSSDQLAGFVRARRRVDRRSDSVGRTAGAVLRSGRR